MAKIDLCPQGSFRDAVYCRSFAAQASYKETI
jgi:hypothetical protein